MPLFRYQALDTNGQLVAGEIEADNVQSSVTELQDRGLSVQSIGIATLSPAGASSLNTATTSPLKRNVRLADGESVERAVLRSHMATILERGRPIAPALRAYAEEMPAGWQRRQLLTVCGLLERGDSIEAAEALAKLPESWIPLLSAATTSPDLGQVLRDFLNESQRTDDLRQKWWLTLTYPVILAILAMVVMTALSIFVIPEFRVILNDIQVQLPAFTRFILGLTSFLATWGVFLLAMLIAVLILLVLNANRILPTIAFGWFGNLFRPPFARRTAIARFARFTADLLESGVSIPDSLRIAGFTVSQSRMQRAAWQLANDLELTGTFLQREYQRPLTSTVAYALAPEMSPKSRVRLLREISNCHAERVRIGLSWTTGIIEPLAICVVGGVVGLTVVALFLPLFSLVTALSN